jgi:hypothetical protein
MASSRADFKVILKLSMSRGRGNNKGIESLESVGLRFCEYGLAKACELAGL